MSEHQQQLPEFIRFLLEPAAYSHPAAGVELVQTHISYVLLAGDYVYKFKKPVNFGFLDFSDLAKRRHFCGEELRLNRRLCPELYLGLVTVGEEGGKLRLTEGEGAAGTVVEYGIKMARMPEAGMMANLIARGELSADHLDRIIAKLAPFYQAADNGPEVRALGTAEAVGVNVLENFAQTEGFIGCPALSRAQFDVIGSYSRRFLAREELFAARIAADRIREGHGDLYSANICFAGPELYIFDCIEFNQRFRCCDVASDIGFLVMDLDFHGLESLSAHLAENFARQANDPGLLTMLRFYTCYRAYVRGKIGLFTAHAPEVDPATKEKSLAMAARYFALAERYARQG